MPSTDAEEGKVTRAEGWDLRRTRPGIGRAATRLLRACSAAFALVVCVGLSCGGSASPAGPGTGGSGGATGGLGGAGGSATGAGGSGAGGVDAGAGGALDAGAMTAVGQFTIIYNGDGGMLTETLTTCTDCRGWYDSTSGYGVLWLEFENSAGAPHTTLVNVQVNPFLNGEYWVGVNFLEDNPSFPFAYQGNYYFSNGAIAMLNTPGMCLATTKIDLSDGGGVAGSLDCMFRGGQSTNQQTAELRGTFSSMFPN